MHYIHEANSFVPLVQVRRASAMVLSETTDAKALMEANGGAYDIEQDPLWNGEQRHVCSYLESCIRHRSTDSKVDIDDVIGACVYILV